MGQLVVPAQTYNDAVSGPDVVINLVASSTFDPFPMLCESFISVAIEYQAITESHTKGKGVLDDCEIIANLDGDGVVGTSDLIILLANWGSRP